MNKKTLIICSIILAIILEYKNLNNYEEIIDIITDTIAKYIKKNNTYIVQKGDSLYQIAKKYNTTSKVGGKMLHATTSTTIKPIIHHTKYDIYIFSSGRRHNCRQ